jgi:O-antigen ligase
VRALTESQCSGTALACASDPRKVSRPVRFPLNSRFGPSGGLQALLVSDDRSGSAVLASLISTITMPLLLLHPQYVPVLGTFRAVTIRISDVAILMTLGVAAFVAAREGSLGRARPWLWLLPFVLLLFISALVTEDSSAPVIAAGKLTEWLVYGVAVTLTMRTAADIRLLIGCLTATALVFGVVGAAEVAVHQARAASLVGLNSLGLFGAFALAVALVAPTLGVGRRVRWALAVAAGLCLITSASFGATVAGLVMIATAAVMGIGFKASLRRRLAAVGVVITVALATVAALRFDDIRGALGGGTAPTAPLALPSVQGDTTGSLAQRAMYADFGIRAWLERPIFGMGFLRSSVLPVWLPLLPDVHADFTTLPDTYFPPAPGTPFQQLQPDFSFGVHTVYLQLLAELGVVGFLLFFAGVAGLTRRAWRGRFEERALMLPLVSVLAGFIDHQFSGGVPDTTVFALALAVTLLPVLATREAASLPCG